MVDLLSSILGIFSQGLGSQEAQQDIPASDNILGGLPPILQMIMGLSPQSTDQPDKLPNLPNHSLPGDIPSAAKQYWPLIVQAAQEKGVDPFRIAAHIWKESGFDPNAKNPSSTAGGIGQFIDSTARSVGLKDKYDPNQAIPAMADLLSRNSQQAGGNWHKASQMYYGSPNPALNVSYANDIERRIVRLQKMFAQQ